VDVAKLEKPPDCGPLLYKHRLNVGKAVTGGFSSGRSSGRMQLFTGVGGDILLIDQQSCTKSIQIVNVLADCLHRKTPVKC
jgi:hypothetical protein